MASKKYRFIITEKAENDLDEILKYISVELVNPDAATSFVEKLLSIIDEICLFPESGALVDNEYIQNKNVRHKVIGNYVMYYLPEKDDRICYVLRIIYGRRDIKKIDLV